MKRNKVQTGGYGTKSKLALLFSIIRLKLLMQLNIIYFPILCQKALKEMKIIIVWQMS